MDTFESAGGGQRGADRCVGRLVERLVSSDDPVLAYKAGLLAGWDPDSVEARSAQSWIAVSPTAGALLRIFEQDATTLQHTYRKWQGPPGR